MKDTKLQLIKFKCDQKQCTFEMFINKNNNILSHYDGSVLLEWKCPECDEGDMRYAPLNAKFIFSLQKEEKVVR